MMQGRSNDYYAPATLTQENGTSEQYPMLYYRDLMRATGYTGPKTKPLGTHAMTLYKYQGGAGDGFAADRNDTTGNFRTGTGPICGLPTLASDADSWENIYNQALSSCYEQTRGQVDLSIDMLQIHQTLQTARKIYDVYRIVRKFDVKALKRSYDAFQAQKFKKKVKDTGSLWLEYVYGVKPTLETVHDTFNLAINQGRRLLTIQGKGKAVKEYEEVIPLVGSFFFGGFRYSCSHYSSQRAKMFFKYDFGAESIDYLAQYTSLNPASIAWENLPFSFVVDWMVDLGGYMRNLETALLMRRSAFSEGYLTLTSLKSGIAVWHRSLYPYTTGHAEGFYREVAKDRSSLGSPPLPKVPSFVWPISGPLRATNAIALLTQFFKTK